jgi:hypothetical protein
MRGERHTRLVKRWRDARAAPLHATSPRPRPLARNDRVRRLRLRDLRARWRMSRPARRLHRWQRRADERRAEPGASHRRAGRPPRRIAIGRARRR